MKSWMLSLKKISPLFLVWVFFGLSSCVNNADDPKALGSIVNQYPPGSLWLIVDNAEIHATSTSRAAGQGGLGPYTYSLDSGLGVVDPVTGVYTPSPIFTGVATIRVKDSEGREATQDVRVYAPLKITPDSKIIYVNQTQTLVASGGKPPYVFTKEVGAGSMSVISTSSVTLSNLTEQTSILVVVKDSLSNEATADITVLDPLKAIAESEIIPANRTMKIRITGGKKFDPVLTAPSAEYKITPINAAGTFVRVDDTTWEYHPPRPYQEERGVDKVEVLIEDDNAQTQTIKFEVNVPPDVTVGSLHSCAMSNLNGKATCWGEGMRGQLGLADPDKKHQPYWGDEPNERSTPTVDNFLRVDFLSSDEVNLQCGGIIDYAMGRDTMCAIVTLGCAGAARRDVRCYGANDPGETGTNLNGLSVEGNYFASYYRHPSFTSGMSTSDYYRWVYSDSQYGQPYTVSAYFRRIFNVVPSQYPDRNEMRGNFAWMPPMTDYSFLDGIGFKAEKIMFNNYSKYSPSLGLISTTGQLRRNQRVNEYYHAVWNGSGLQPALPSGAQYKEVGHYTANVYTGRSCFVGTDDYGYCLGGNIEGSTVGVTGRGDSTNNISVLSSPGVQEVVASRVTLGLTADEDKMSSITYHKFGGCAVMDITNTKRVACWGGNTYYSLGIGNTTEGTNSPTAQFVQISAGVYLNDAVKVIGAGGPNDYTESQHHVCASIANGNFYCWGSANSNQIPGYSGYQAFARQVNLGANEKVIDFDMVGSGTCVLTQNSSTMIKSLKCWGGGAPSASERTHYAVPKPYPSNNTHLTTITTFAVQSDATKVKMSVHAGCLLDGTSKYLKCWGDNRRGILGISNGARGNKPLEMGVNLPKIDVGAGRTVKKMVAGGEHTCAILDSGRVKCWGSNLFGQLGIGALTGIDNFDHRGDNDNEMGDNLPALTFSGDPDHKAKLLASGHDHACAVTVSNNMYCWGDNKYGQLGQVGTAAPVATYSTPQKVDLTGLGDIIGIAAGHSHTCAAFDQTGVHSLRCWGSHEFGQLGYGQMDFVTGIGSSGHTNKIISDAALDVDPKDLPAVDLGGKNIKQIAAKGYNTCVLFDTGKMRCFGKNVRGQIGVGSYDLNADSINDPMGDDLAEIGHKYLIDFGINPLTMAPHYVIQFSMGHDFVCAVLDSNKLKCFGNNAHGQLGIENTQHKGDNNNEMGSSLPYVNLEAGVGVLSVDSGMSHSCAVLTNANIKCWGTNFSGQLGFGADYSRGYSENSMSNSLPYVDLTWD